MGKSPYKAKLDKGQYMHLTCLTPLSWCSIVKRARQIKKEIRPNKTRDELVDLIKEIDNVVDAYVDSQGRIVVDARQLMFPVDTDREGVEIGVRRKLARDAQKRRMCRGDLLRRV